MITNSDILQLTGEPGNFKARIKQEARYVDLEKCTSCGECAKVCPIEIEDEYNKSLNTRKAIFKQYAQAIPGAYGITKKGTAPCKATCPAHVSIQGFVALAREGKHREALELFKEDHPFPGACGRVCHHPCESECTRNEVDYALAVQHMHRFLADHDLDSEEPFIPEIEEEKKEKIAIVGSGPAGMSAGFFLAKKGYKVTIFEKLPVKGGMMAVGIPEYRLPQSELDREIDLIEKMGIEIKTGVNFGVDVTLDDLKSDGCSAVFLATGLHGSRGLGIEGEDKQRVHQGVEFLRNSAIEGKVEIGNKVVVIGGGNVAVDVALTARRHGAQDVSLVCLETREEMPAWDYEIQDALDEGVKIINSLGPKKFSGNGTIEGVEFKKCKSVFDVNGSFNPQYDESDIKAYEADDVIIAIGQSAELEFTDKQKIEVTRQGGLSADPLTLQTPLDWVFAGGDVVYGPKSVVDAVACGKEAAISIDRFINGENLIDGRDKVWDLYRPDVKDESIKERVNVQALSIEEREGNFKEVHKTLTEEQVIFEAERCLKCGVCSECYQCVDACLASAINHEETAKTLELDVGSVVLTAGSQVYDPTHLKEFYHYGKNPNVMTSIEFERILSASGPTMGHLQKPSDGSDPKRIAWLQCVGSRDNNRCGNGYCSSVCCMYAVKDAMIAKEHADYPLDCTIFNMDIRTFGKDYEKYYHRAKNEEGVQFIKTRIHTIYENKADDTLTLRYVTEHGEIVEDKYDMVVLSVGLQIPEETQDLAKRLDVKLNKYNFAETQPFSPLETSRKGVFVSGALQGPKDIPSSVTEASAAACAAGMDLAEARHTTTKSVEVPEEIDVIGQEPRVGVFVCNCGINISGTIDVPKVVDYASKLPNVVYTGENLFTCSQDAQDGIKEIIIEEKLNRIVVASCSPKTHEPIFMDTMQSVGLNKYLFEMANIRNQNSWVHSSEPELATQKAIDLVRMAISRVVQLQPLHEKVIGVTKRALVIGGGVAGMNASLGLANQGFEVVLIEKEDKLGGFANKLVKTIEGADVKQYISDLSENVESNKNIQVLKQALIVGHSGFKGNFVTEVLVGPGMYERKIEHGVVILATGANEYKPKEFLYGENESVMTQVELADTINEKGASHIDSAVMIQCVGSRNEDNVNCSRICCQGAVKNAISIKKSNPEANVFILYRDIRTYGFLEDYYKEARELGVIFSRFDADNPPVVENNGKGATVTFKDHILGMDISMDVDLVALSAGMVAEDTDELASIMKLGRNEEGHFIEAHVKLRPVDMPQEGIFVCGTAHSPKLISETIAQSMGAASRATTFLSQESLTLSAVTAEVIQEHCASCLICVRSCPYGVPKIDETGKSVIDVALCQGCGICASECPAKTINLNWYEDVQLLSKIESLLEGVL